WFMENFNSPYFLHPEEFKRKSILENIIRDKDFKIDKELKEGQEKYKELHSTTSLKMLTASLSAINKMETYFNDVDYATQDIDKVAKAIERMPKLMSSINEAIDICKKEQSTGVKTRGDVKTGAYEE
ncbi:MAG: hypothetical protein AABY22_19245, partial [Nanoarchaeota archaeon]